MVPLPRSYGGRVWFRLSDVPLEKRLAAADRLKDQLARQRTDMVDVFADFERRAAEAAEIDRVAERPSDAIRTVSVKAWTKVMGAPP